MKYRICERCKKKPAVEQHHMFSKGLKTGWRYKNYGELLHDPRNIQWLCYDCHHNKPLKKFTELEFCYELNIIPRSKTSQTRLKREKII